MSCPDTGWGRSAVYHNAYDRRLNGFHLVVEPFAGSWRYAVRNGSVVAASGRAKREEEAMAAAERLAQAKVLRVGNWTARWRPLHPASIDLDYEGKVFKRSQQLIRYPSGSLGYDFPEAVPEGVRKRVEAWAARLP